MRRFLLGLLAIFLLAIPGAALAQSPCPYIVYGAVLTPAQWNACFSSKVDLGSGSTFPAPVVANSFLATQSNLAPFWAAQSTLTTASSLTSATLPVFISGGAIQQFGIQALNVTSPIALTNPAYVLAASSITLSLSTVGVPTGGTGQTSFTANLPLLGNGTSALGQGTISGTTTEFATVSGSAPVNGNCASWNSGNLVDNGSACGSGGGGSGTVSSGTANQIAVYAANGTTVSGAPASPLANAILYTNGSSVLNESQTLPSAVQANITGTGTLSSGATGSGFTVALATSTISGILGGANGGTGINNGSFTITVGGNVSTAGALTTTGTGAITLAFPNSSAVYSFPGTTDTLVGINATQTITGTKTFNNSAIKLLGSSTGATTFTSANAGATNYTVTFPAATDTVAELTQTQTLTNKTISSASNTITLTTATNTSGFTSGDLLSTSSNQLADSGVAAASFATPSQYGYPYGGTCITNDPPCTAGDGASGGLSLSSALYPTLGNSNVWITNSVTPALYTSRSPIATGYSPSVVTCSSCSGQLFRLQFASASFSTQTVSYTANGGDTAATVATAVCNAVIANTTLSNPTTGWPFICDAGAGGGNFNLEYAVGTVFGISAPTVTSTGTGTITLPARADTLDGAFWWWQRRVTGHSLTQGDLTECWIKAFNSIITFQMCTLASSSTSTVETFDTFTASGTTRDMGVGGSSGGVATAASDGNFGLGPFGGAGTLTISNVSGGGGIYFAKDGDSAVDSFLRENTGNAIAWTLGSGNAFELVANGGSTVLWDYNVTNLSATTISTAVYLPSIPGSGGTQFVCRNASTGELSWSSSAC